MNGLLNLPTVTAAGNTPPSAPSLQGNWRNYFVDASGQPPLNPQPQMQASPYMMATPLGNNTMGYGIDPEAFQGLLESMRPPAEQSAPLGVPPEVLAALMPGRVGGILGLIANQTHFPPINRTVLGG